MRQLALTAPLLAAFALALWQIMPAHAQPIVPDSFFLQLKRPASPNTWLVAPQGFMPAPDAAAPLFEVPIARLEAAFTRVALQNGRAVIAEKGEHWVHIVDTTPVLRFKDDVHVQFIALGEARSTLAAYSASRVGYSDFGTNRRRLEGWLRDIGDRLK